MKKSLFFKLTLAVISLSLLAAVPGMVFASDTEDTTELTSEEAGVSAEEAAGATEEYATTVHESGMLIEIGNTTAEETTVIIRVAKNGETEDKTVQITADTQILTNANRKADLSDWIAGDHISYTAEVGDNSGELVASVLRNLSFNWRHAGKNGWVKEIRTEENEMDVEWANQIFTLDVSEARMVAGLINPASLENFEVGDRVRARVTDDGDNNRATWKAEIVVVLRRGDALFMRVTRWVVPAKITSIPEDTSTLPYVITAEVLPSKFFEAGDVNNLIGEPGSEISIQVNENTRLVRRFLGKADIGEFMEGDNIRVIGRLNDGTGNIDANLIKNNSIQRLGVSSRISEVTAVDLGANTITAFPIGIRNPLTGKRYRIDNSRQWTVEVDSDTVIMKNGESIELSDIDVSDIIRVRGTANRIRKTVDADAVSVVTDKFGHLLEN